MSDLSINLDIDLAEALHEACEFLDSTKFSPYDLIIELAGSLEQEEREEFINVMLRQAHLMKTPVNITVAQSHLRIDHVSYTRNRIYYHSH